MASVSQPIYPLVAGFGSGPGEAGGGVAAGPLRWNVRHVIFVACGPFSIAHLSCPFWTLGQSSSAIKNGRKEQQRGQRKTQKRGEMKSVYISVGPSVWLSTCVRGLFSRPRLHLILLHHIREHLRHLAPRRVESPHQI